MARKMKDSGVPWIGEIPVDWPVDRIKTHYSIISGSGFPVNIQGFEYGDFPVAKAGDIAKCGKNFTKSDNNISKEIANQYGFSIVPVGSILFAKIGEAMKKNNRAISSVDCCVDNNCEALVPAGMNSEWSYYLSMCINMAWFDNASTIPCINNQRLLNCYIPAPRFHTQQHIALFLNEQCTKIDSIIEKIKATVEEYKRLKQAIITQAVTKGIRGDRPMKDSGIGWIGEIPADWHISRLKRYCSLKTGSTPSTANAEWFNGDLDWFTPGDFGDNYYLVNSQRKLTKKAKEDEVAVIIPSNTVLIIGIGGTAGKIGVTESECSCNQQITALLTKKVHYRYLMYWMIANTTFLKETALYTTLPILNNETIGKYLFITPSSYAEQIEIANYLDKRCAEIDALIAKKTTLLDELENYKRSIIYEYVTGKKEAERI